MSKAEPTEDGGSSQRRNRAPSLSKSRADHPSAESRAPLTRTQAILHPVRMRIVIALNDQPMTARQVAREMQDVPLATLYRQFNVLADAGLIEVVDEQRVHGALERRFALANNRSFVRADEITPDEIVGIVSALTSAVQSNFQQYACNAEFPPKEGEISAMASSLYVTDEEYAALRAAIKDLIGKTGRAAGPEYNRRFVAFFSVPIIEPE
jgi:DNA-binding transcriptional ArsR family regulator